LSGLNDLDLSLSNVDIISPSSRAPCTFALLSPDADEAVSPAPLLFILLIFPASLPPVVGAGADVEGGIGALSLTGLPPLAGVEDVPGVWLFSLTDGDEDVTSWSLALMFSDRSGGFLGGNGGGMDDAACVSERHHRDLNSKHDN
jgi:hypothetical protein